MQLLRSLDTINALMFLWKLRQIKLLRNMITLLLTLRLNFIKKKD